MRYVRVKYHVFTGIPAGLYFPVDEVKIAFLSAGVAIDLAKGRTFTTEPKYAPGYPALVKEFWNTDRTVGHIVLSHALRGVNPRIAGALLDPERRGLCAVFTDSDYIRNHGQRAVVQSCVHEIAHLLNLDHSHTNNQFPSAVDQAKRRTVDPDKIRQAWVSAGADSGPANQPSYFSKPAIDPLSLPFAYLSRHRLNTLPENSLQPWGSRFERPFGGDLEDAGL